jgi:rRNA maturation protein Rpf1
MALPGPSQIAQIVKYAADAGFTNLLVFHETKKFSKGARVDGLLLVHLPAGPSAMFRISNVKLTKDISGHGRASTHTPELILNNFTTALGHRVGRMLASLLPQDPEFRGRRVITMHNQRDFIFFRHHRYVFEQREGARKKEHTGHLAPAIAPPPPGTNRKKQKKSKKAAAAQEQGDGFEAGDGENGHVVARLQELGPRFTLKLQARADPCLFHRCALTRVCFTMRRACKKGCLTPRAASLSGCALLQAMQPAHQDASSSCETQQRSNYVCVVVCMGINNAPHMQRCSSPGSATQLSRSVQGLASSLSSARSLRVELSRS